MPTVKILPEASSADAAPRFFEIQLSLDATPLSEDIVANIGSFVNPQAATCNFVSVCMGKEHEAQSTEEKLNAQFDGYLDQLKKNEFDIARRYFIRDARSIEEGVLHHVNENPPSLLVMGMHQTPPKRHFWRILSNSYAIARHVPCSCLIYKRPPKDPNKLKVLFTTDGSIQSGSGAALMSLFMPRDKVELSVCSVISEDFFAMPQNLESYVDYTEFKRGLEAETTQLLLRTREFFESAGFKVASSYFVEGDPVEKIMDEVQRYDIDLVVLGSSSKGGHLTSFLLGDVSAKILENCQASVAILR